jgi:hypothetical protein
MHQLRDVVISLLFFAQTLKYYTYQQFPIHSSPVHKCQITLQKGGPTSPKLKSPEREADNSSPNSDEIKNGGAISPLHRTSSWRRVSLIKHKNNLMSPPKSWMKENWIPNRIIQLCLLYSDRYYTDCTCRYNRKIKSCEWNKYDNCKAVIQFCEHFVHAKTSNYLCSME